MGANSRISWTNHTFNPWRGCSKVHEGCAHCYAEREAKRFPLNRGTWGTEAQGGTRVKAAAAQWREPIKWNLQAKASKQRARVFCASLADVFESWGGPVVDHEGRQLYTINGRQYFTEEPGDLRNGTGRKATLADLRRDLFELIDATPWLDWLLLTKRPENIPGMWPKHVTPQAGLTTVYRPNVWLGTSVSLQEHAEALKLLVLGSRNLSPVLFASVEPMLGPVDLSDFLMIERDRPTADGRVPWRISSKWGEDPLLDWVIAGGESGPGARPLASAWVTDLAAQCKAAGTPFHFKQWGEYLPISRGYPRIGDGTESVMFDGARRELVDAGHGSERYVKVGVHHAGNQLHGKLYLEFPEVKGAEVSP